MKNSKQRTLALCIVLAAIIVLALPSAAFAQDTVTTSQLRACHDYVWQQPKFSDIPNAGVSIGGSDVKGDGNARVHWKVQWDDMRTHGTCIVNRNNKVIDFQEHYSGNDYEHGAGHPTGIYYDTYSRRWIASDGQVCNTCTPENGFKRPVTDGEFYYDPDIRKWRQSSERGAVCNTCTPENGFPIPPNRR